MQTAQAREMMVEQQVRTWSVLDERVLEILRNVPRERFVPAAHAHLAFADIDIPLPHGQHMLRPNVAGRLLQALQLSGAERVLEIGAGSGFVTACLASAAAHVTSLEIFADLADSARANLGALGLNHKADVQTADALQWEPGERYDAIALTASLPIYDPRFQQMLKVGGRLFAVVGTGSVMDARLIRREAEDRFRSESLFETVISPLINARQPSRFSF